MNKWVVVGILLALLVVLLAVSFTTKKHAVDVQPTEINALGEYHEVNVPENIAVEVNVLPSPEELNAIAEDVDIEIPPEI